MAAKDVYASRDEAAKVLIENLRTYGNLEPPGAYGRPYNGGTRTCYQFSCANYLRMEAASRAHRDNRWFSDATIAEKSYTLKDGAKPVEIEYWYGIENGQGFDGSLRRFYNAEDILELENTLEPTTGDQDSDRAYAQGLLLDNGAAIAGIEPNNENLYHGMWEYAREQGLNPIGEKMSAQLFMKTCKLSYDYAQDPLFTEEELQHMESNPKILFYGMKQANNLMKGMLEAETRRKQQGQENQMPDQPARPFAGLSVTPLYSDIPITGPDGKAYADGEILQGEAAYGFLVQLNALDKERFDAIQRGEGKAAMAELLFSYGSYDHGPVPLKVGSLELRNKESIQEALSYKLMNFRQSLLADAELRKTYLHFNQIGTPSLNENKLLTECRQQLKECEKAMARFAWDEKRYCKEHPEIQAINERKAWTYRYACTKEMKEQLGEFPQAFVLNVTPADGKENLYLDGLDQWETATPAMRKLNPMPANAYLIETTRRPDQLAMDGYARKLQIAFTLAEVEAMEQLSKLQLHSENHGPVDRPFAVPVIEDYSGMAAIRHLQKERAGDARYARRWQETGAFRRGYRKDVSLSLEDKKLGSCSYEEGQGRFAQEQYQKMTELLGKEDPRLQAGCQVFQRYAEPERSGGFKAGNIPSPEKRQSYLEAQQAAIREHRPGEKAKSREWYEYYASLALRDDRNDTPEKFQRAVIGEMQKDGISNRKIEGIIKQNKAFDKALLSTKKAAGKKQQAIIIEEKEEQQQKKQRVRQRSMR